jgi:hypothetical protein
MYRTTQSNVFPLSELLFQMYKKYREYEHNTKCDESRKVLKELSKSVARDRTVDNLEREVEEKKKRRGKSPSPSPNPKKTKHSNTGWG